MKRRRHMYTNESIQCFKMYSPMLCILAKPMDTYRLSFSTSVQLRTVFKLNCCKFYRLEISAFDKSVKQCQTYHLIIFRFFKKNLKFCKFSLEISAFGKSGEQCQTCYHIIFSPKTQNFANFPPLEISAFGKLGEQCPPPLSWPLSTTCRSDTT